MRALVVDDDFTSRIPLQEALAGYGEVHSYMNGVEAIQAANRAMDLGARYDLICLDIMMPGLSGLDTLKQIRSDEERRGLIGDHAAKVIMVTALNDARNVMRAFRTLRRVPGEADRDVRTPRADGCAGVQSGLIRQIRVSRGGTMPSARRDTRLQPVRFAP